MIRVNRRGYWTAAGGSLLPAFASTLRTTTGATVTAVRAARNGAGWFYDTEGQGTWSPDGDVMASAVAQIDRAIERRGRPLSGIVAFAGESDAIVATTERFSRDDFANGFRRSLRMLHDRYLAPIYVILPGDITFDMSAKRSNLAADMVRATMNEVLTETEFARFAHVVHDGAHRLGDFGTEFMKADGLHFNQRGLDRIGAEAAAGVAARWVPTC